MSLPRYFIGRDAFLQLNQIEVDSFTTWGAQVAAKYMHDLYAAFDLIADNPRALAKPRQHRSQQFMMVAARSHFVIYDQLPIGPVVILGIEPQARDIESLIVKMSRSYKDEIAALQAEYCGKGGEDE